MLTDQRNINRRHLLLAAIYLSYFLISLDAISATIYSVNKGDTLSGVVSSCIRKPIYGKNGNLALILKLNPEIKNLNQIYVGQVIKLSSELKCNLDQESPQKTLAKEDESIDQVPVTTYTSVDEKMSDYSLQFDFLKPNIKISGTERLNNSKGNLNSSDTYGFGLKLILPIASSLSVETKVKMNEIHFSKSKTRKIRQDDFHFYEYALGPRFHFGSNSSLSLLAGQEDVPMYTATSANDISISKIEIPYTQVEYTYFYFRNNSFQLNGKINYKHFLSGKYGDYTINRAQQYGAGIDLKRKLINSKYEIGPEFNWSYYDVTSKYLNLSRQDIILTFGLIGHF